MNRPPAGNSISETTVQWRILSRLMRANADDFLPDWKDAIFYGLLIFLLTFVQCEKQDPSWSLTLFFAAILVGFWHLMLPNIGREGDRRAFKMLPLADRDWALFVFTQRVILPCLFLTSVAGVYVTSRYLWTGSMNYLSQSASLFASSICLFFLAFLIQGLAIGKANVVGKTFSIYSRHNAPQFRPRQRKHHSLLFGLLKMRFMRWVWITVLMSIALCCLHIPAASRG